MHHSDVVVNSASTMTIDALVCATPAVCLDFTLPPFEDFAPVLHNFYDYEHYRPITRSGAMRFARSPEELVNRIRAYLADPELDSKERADLVRYMVGTNPGESVQCMADGILSLLMDRVDAHAR
jgi:hypothetical protein